MRNIIFISHSTPDDNEFSIWLASRLELLGYKVWIDKSELLGGEKFWQQIDLVIRNEAVKFLLVYSSNILQNGTAGTLKEGVYKEFSMAEGIARQNPELSDFITLLNIDNSPYNLFIGADRLNQISFKESWGKGFKTLIEKFTKDSIPKYETNTEFSSWYLNNISIENPITSKKEYYFTNWWSVKKFPHSFLIYRFANKAQAEAVFKQNQEYPISIIANCICTFNPSLNFTVENENGQIEIHSKEQFEIKVSDLLLGMDRSSFPTYNDCVNHFKKLLKRTLHNFLKGKKLSWHEQSNKSLAYFHTLNSLPTSKVRFNIPFSQNKTKMKQLFGKYLNLGKWHFAPAFKPILEPYLGFELKSHLIFSNDGFYPWDNKETMHIHRRKKGKRMFNEEWRDLLVGYVNSLKDDYGQITIPVSEESIIIMNDNLEIFWSDFGYYDPTDESRQEIFTDEFADEEIDNFDEQVV